MSAGFFVVALAYALFLAAVVGVEWIRTRSTGIDSISVFVALFLLQCVLPGVFIYGLLPAVDPAAPTTNPVFDRILQSVDGLTAVAVLVLTLWFIVFFYAGCALGRLALGGWAGAAQPPRFNLAVRPRVLLLLVAAGLAVTLYSFMLMGSSWRERYTNLILFRAGYEGIERTALNANAFALTQTWSWLSVVGLFAISERKRRGLSWVLMLLMSLALAILGVSRRSLFLPLVLAYLVVVLHRGRWYRRWILASALPVLAIVAFGKNALAAVAWSGDIRSVASVYESAASALLRGMSEIGLNILESVGTLLFLDVPPRFGIDHVLAIARRVPEGMVGLSFEWPERIVRVSTEALAGASDQDIPPGLAGQMWLDFRAFGPVVWGILFGLQLSVVQYIFERTRRSAQACAAFVMVVFVLAMPLTTGSFDFTFSVDIIMLCVALLLAVRLRREPATTPLSPGSAGVLAGFG